MVEPSQHNISVSPDVQSLSVNLSWTTVNVNRTYNLTVKSSSPYSQSFQLNNTNHYIFTAPKGSKPCDVFNFSVIATYIGASYTGADCSVPSMTPNMMLPSLPDAKIIESTLKYSLEKMLDEGVKLSVSFEVGEQFH